MRRPARRALLGLALGVVALHLGLLGGLPGVLRGESSTGLTPAPGGPVSPVLLLAAAGMPTGAMAPDPAAASNSGAAPAAASIAPASPAAQPTANPPSVPPRGLAPRPSTAPAVLRPEPAPPSATTLQVVQDPVFAAAPDEPAPAALSPPASEPHGASAPAPGAEVSGPSTALPPLPVYRTRVPPAARIVYRLSRGLIVGTGELDWRPQAAGYQLRLEGKLPLIGTLITQTSRGRLDAAGLAPERHTDQRLRRSEQAANFQREQGVVSFSGGARSVPLAPGLQDRLSVMIQLAAIAAAGPQPPPDGQALSIGVVGVRGDVAVWVLRFEGVQALDTPDGPVKAWRYLRQPESPHETVAEFWLDPTRQFLPVRVKLTDGNSEPLELRRQSHEP